MIRRTPFHKLLIANRGEIARRVIRTARALGYRTVAIYSTVDSNSLHVRDADEAAYVGEELPSQSYLSIKRILEAAAATGADVGGWPGRGRQASTGLAGWCASPVSGHVARRGPSLIQVLLAWPRRRRRTALSPTTRGYAPRCRQSSTAWSTALRPDFMERARSGA